MAGGLAAERINPLAVLFAERNRLVNNILMMRNPELLQEGI